MPRFFTNFPIPVPNLIMILGGLVLQKYWVKWKVAIAFSEFIGFGFVIVAVLIIIWAVSTSLRVEIDHPKALLISGPYAFSRNPMYVGWNLLQLGIGFALSNLWIVLLTVPAFLTIHFYDVLKEEQILKKRFGSEYGKYASKVRRYI